LGAAAVYGLLVLAFTLRAQDDFGHVSALRPLIFVLLPAAIFLTFRCPLIFPFVLYVGLMPFDPLLSFSSNFINLKLLAGIAGGALFLHILLVRRALVPPRAWFAWGLLVAFAALSLLWDPDWGRGVYTVNEMVGLFLIMTALALYPASRKEFTIAAAGIALTGIAAALYAIVQSHGANVTDSGRLMLTAINNFALDPNYLAASFTMPVALSLAFLDSSRSFWVKLLCAGAVVLMFLADLMTGSRGGFFAVLAAILYFGIRGRYRVQTLSLGGLVLASSAFFPLVWQRLANDPQGDQSGSGRTVLWEIGMHNFKDHWLFGSGAGSYVYNYDQNILETHQRLFQGWDRPGHSIIFVGLNDFGVVGLILVLACWYMSFRQLRIVPKTHSLYGFRLACEAMIVGLFIEAQFIDPFYIKYVWVAHGLALMVVNQYAPRLLRAGRPARDEPLPADFAPAPAMSVRALRGF
jgi:hypothetical protein